MYTSNLFRGVVLALACCVSMAASAQPDEPRRLDIPAGELIDALDVLARQSGAELIYRADQLRGVQTRGARGRLSVEAALELLLEGSGLTVRKDPSGAILIVRQDQQASPDSSSDESRDDAADSGAVEIDALVVTGTHIRNVSPVGSPVLVLDAEDIRRSGYSGTEQVIQALPQNFRGGEAGASADVNFSVGSQRGFNMTSGSGVNLRGLGANASLVLINGRRIAASSGGTFTDISMIPLNAIERIEVFADGASAVYGADAVGGVVNIILKSDYDSAESRVSYGATTESGREEYRVSHSMGRYWDGGNATISADYLDQSHLLASEREFTSQVPDPTSIFPSNKLASVMVSGQHALTDMLTMKGELQYSRAERFSVVTAGNNARSESLTKPERHNIALTLDYLLQSGWDVELDLFASGEEARSRQHDYLPDGSLNYEYLHVRKLAQQGAEIKGNGSLFELPGGTVRLAAGLAYKEEDYRRTIDLFSVEHRVDRSNFSAFSELHVPLIGDDNARTGFHRLDLSVAARHDDYSDFGSSSNPRIGLSWSPTPGLTLRSSYSTSFRAPAIGEEARFSADGLLGGEVVSFPSADGAGTVPVVMWFGSEELRPEESRNRSVGFDWNPLFAPDLSLSLTYYRIKYTDRIILPPLDTGALSNPELDPFLRHYEDPAQLRALVEAATERGLPFFDSTFGEFGPDPLSLATVAYHYMWTNAQRVETSGYDVSIHYPFQWNEHAFETGLDASYIERSRTQLSSTAVPFDTIGTFGNPSKLRARGSLVWMYRGLSTALNLNYTHSYTDTSGLLDRPVGSYTTTDLTSRYTFASGSGGFVDGLSVSLIAINLFDRQPPYIEAGGWSANYDPANASPLGRMVSLQVGKQW